MKKYLILSFLSLLLLFSNAWAVAVVAAGPFLTCDAYDTAVVGTPPNQFGLIFDGGAEVTSPAVTGWGPATTPNLWTLKYDLSGLADGTHNVKGRACILNEIVQECSDYSAVWTFSKGKPATPSISVVKTGTPAQYFLQSGTYASTAIGGPPSTFNMSIDGGATTSVAAITNADGSTYFKYEITNMSTGNHTINISAQNDWGASATVAASFQRYVVVVPKGVRILK